MVRSIKAQIFILPHKITWDGEVRDCDEEFQGSCHCSEPAGCLDSECISSGREKSSGYRHFNKQENCVDFSVPCKL